MLINYICQYCGKECKNLNSLKQHELRCKQNPNRIINKAWNKGLCKNTDKRVSINEYNSLQTKIKNKENKISEYNKNPKLCLQCGKPLSYQQFKYGQKFCCYKCSNLSRPPKSEESKRRTSNTLKNNYKYIIQKQIRIEEYNKNPNKCIVCGSNLSYKERDRKTCCKECKSNLLRKAGQKAASKTVKRSIDEIKLYNLCSKHFNVTHNIPIVNDWDADIILEDYKIAILWNGPWHYKEMNINNHSLKQVINRDILKIIDFEKIGWNVLIYQDNQFTPETALVDILLKVKKL